MPEEEEVKRGKWTFAHLPAIPSHFALKPIEKNENRLQDAAEADQAQGRRRADQRLRRGARGRADLPLHRPVREIGQADPAAVAAVDDAGVDPRRLRASCAPTRQMRPLADAAVCRSESDWLVGINGTRAMTAFNSKSGGFQLTTVGRVQTPTLAILVEREEKIRTFVPRDYWEVAGTFRARPASTTAAGSTRTSGSETTTIRDAARRALWDEARARAIAREVRRQARASSPRNRSRRRRARRCSTTSRACSARPTAASASRRGRRSRSRRRSTKSTRC